MERVNLKEGRSYETVLRVQFTGQQFSLKEGRTKLFYYRQFFNQSSSLFWPASNSLCGNYLIREKEGKGKQLVAYTWLTCKVPWTWDPSMQGSRYRQETQLSPCFHVWTCPGCLYISREEQKRWALTEPACQKIKLSREQGAGSRDLHSLIQRIWQICKACLNQNHLSRFFFPYLILNQSFILSSTVNITEISYNIAKLTKVNQGENNIVYYERVHSSSKQYNDYSLKKKSRVTKLALKGKLI